MTSKPLKHLEPAAAVALQARLLHFLKKYRRSNNMSVDQMAAKLSYSVDHYKQFELSNPNNRLISSLDFVCEFAQLAGMSISEFVNYLSDVPLDKRQDLYPWEKELLVFFNGCDLMIRRRFTGMLQIRDRAKVERSLAAAERLAQLPDEELTAIEKILDAMTGTRSS
jgi:transcriptional regulator with XRE-family HTH domain